MDGRAARGKAPALGCLSLRSVIPSFGRCANHGEFGCRMADALDEQIEAFQALLPEIKARHGSTWVLIADRQLVGAFPSFPAAARFASETYGRQEVLIRHTDERLAESAPFVQVHVER